MELAKLIGSLTTSATAADGTISEDAEVLSERMVLKGKLSQTFVLADDAILPVAFGALASASLIMVRASTKVKVRITSADGATQAIPVHGLLLLFDVSVPVTALDVVRLPGVETEVTVFLGEKAA